MNLRYSPLAVVVLLVSCQEPPAPVSAEQQFLDDVAEAMGGSIAIEAANTLVMEAEGSMLNLGQDLTPESATMEFSISDYRMTGDLVNGSSHTELTRTPLFDYFRGRDPMRLVSGIDGNIAYDVSPDGSARRAHDDIAADRRSTFYHHPLPLLRAALTGAAKVSNVRTVGDQKLADVAVGDGMSFTLSTNSTSHLPTYISSTNHHNYLRDVVRQTGFSDYMNVGDLMLPATIRQSLDEFHVFELHATSQAINAPGAETGAPADAANAPAISGSGTANVTAEELGDGIWLLAGQSHHSVLFEFSDHLKLLEAPNEVRTLAVIAKARELVPGKPLTHMINTHHHFDHSGGLRAAIAEGLTVVTQAANEAFYRRMASQPSDLKPDALARSPQPIAIEVFNDKLVFEDDSMTLELYHVAGNPHSSSILMAYLPNHRILIEADLYNPGRSTPQLFAPNLLDNVRENGLEVERLVPIHGGVVPFSDLEAAVQAMNN